MRSIFTLVLGFYLFNPFFAQAQKKYNVIFISVDDLSIAFQPYGNPDAPTPNYIRLAQHGMLFKQTYCQYALCSPSRTSLLSGKRPDSTGIFNNNDTVRTYLGAGYKFLPEYFDAYGYQTDHFGKVGPCEHEQEIKWDYSYANHASDLSSPPDIPVWCIDTLHKNETETKPGNNTAAFISHLRQPEATPYFYGLGLSTHNPFTPVLDFWNKTGDSSVKKLLQVDINGTTTKVKGNGSSNIILPDTPADDTLDIPQPARINPLSYTPAEAQDIRHAYYGEIIQMDANLGALLDEMDSLNIWDSTIVVFWSDHGQHMGEHLGLWLKLSLFEESLRVPFIICAPGKKKGICNTPVEYVDIFPTLTELCGLPMPDGMQGSSLVPLLENPEAPWKKAVFAQQYRKLDAIMARSVRTARYHYNTWLQYGEELYDIKNDPHEYTNLVNNPAFAPVLDSMRSLLAAGWQGALPPVYTKHSFFKDNDGDGYGERNDSTVAYFAPAGYADKYGDCNDNNAEIHPDADEKPCNGRDDNCDSKVDENKPVPVITPLGSLDICNTGSVELKTNTNSDFTYQWQKNGQNIPGATKRKYTAETRGIYKVVITYKALCGNISEGVTVTNSCSLNEPGNSAELNVSQKAAVSLYPNPSDGNIKITYTCNNSEAIQLKILDMSGQVLFTKPEQANGGANIYQLNQLNLKPGTYTLEVNNGTVTQHIKFVIVK